jgi:hypothetical protein
MGYKTVLEGGELGYYIPGYFFAFHPCVIRVILQEQLTVQFSCFFYGLA